MICKRLYKSRKKCSYFYYLLHKLEILHLLEVCLQRFMEKCIMYTASDSDKFHGQVCMALKGIFSIFLLAELIKFIVFLQVCQISKHVFHSTKILFFVLIPRCCCFRVRYASRCNIYRQS